jgi:CBS domain-containing protein
MDGVRVEELDQPDWATEPSVIPHGHRCLPPMPLWGYMAIEIMSSPVITCRDDATIEQVDELLAECKISGTAVINGHSDVVGIISRSDLSAGFSSPVLSIAKRRRSPKVLPLEGTGALTFGPVRARDVMSTPPVIASLDTPLHVLAKTFVEEEIDRILVMDEARLCGIVTRGDVLAATAGLPRHHVRRKLPSMIGQNSFTAWDL